MRQVAVFPGRQYQSNESEIAQAITLLASPPLLRAWFLLAATYSDYTQHPSRILETIINIVQG